MSADSQRWHKAQAYERDWWQSRAPDMDLDFYASFAQALRREIDGLPHLGARDAHSRSWQWSRWHPHPSRGKQSSPRGRSARGLLRLGRAIFSAFRDPVVQYYTGTGEKLDFADDHFDLVIVDNVPRPLRRPGSGP